MFTVYVIRSLATRRLYTGQTSDLPFRMMEHSAGVGRYTQGRGPWELIHTEEFATRAEAVRRERYLKSGIGREWLHGKLSGRAGPPAAD